METTMLNAFETTLTAQMGATDLTATVADRTGLVSPCWLVIEPDSATQREYVLFDGTFLSSPDRLVTTDIANRYGTGSAAGSGLTHPTGSVVRMAAVAQQHEEVHDRIDTLNTSFSSHHGGTATADHPEATVSTRGLMSAADKQALDIIGTSVSLTGSLVDLADATWTSIDFDTAVNEDWEAWAVTPNPERLTIATTGIYTVSAEVYFQAEAAGSSADIRQVDVTKDGGRLGAAKLGQVSTTLTTLVLKMYPVFPLTAGEYLGIDVYADWTAGTHDVTAARLDVVRLA